LEQPRSSENDALSTADAYALVPWRSVQEHAKTVQAIAAESPDEQVEELEARRDEIVAILEERGVGVKPKPVRHVDEKKETHREFLLKEMVRLQTPLHAIARCADIWLWWRCVLVGDRRGSLTTSRRNASDT
jgi:hypothetical protein